MYKAVSHFNISVCSFGSMPRRTEFEHSKELGSCSCQNSSSSTCHVTEIPVLSKVPPHVSLDSARSPIIPNLGVPCKAGAPHLLERRVPTSLHSLCTRRSQQPISLWNNNFLLLSANIISPAAQVAHKAFQPTQGISILESLTDKNGLITELEVDGCLCASDYYLISLSMQTQYRPDQ